MELVFKSKVFFGKWGFYDDKEVVVEFKMVFMVVFEYRSFLKWCYFMFDNFFVFCCFVFDRNILLCIL